MEVETIWELSECPDCILPLDQQTFIVSTYELQQGQKTGSFHIKSHQLQHIYKENKGILDFKIKDNLLLSVTSNGQIDWYQVDFTQKSLLKIHTNTLSQKCLTYTHIQSQWAFITDTEGTLTILDLPSQTILQEKKTNIYQQWFVYADKNNYYLPISQGKLGIYDRRSGIRISLIRVSEQDVCSISQYNDLITTGTFDGWLSEIDLRRHEVTSRLQIGGGIWRHFYTPFGPLAACMQQGFKLLDWNLPTKSLAYGLSEFGQSFLGCSFYSKEIIKFNILNCLWQLETFSCNFFAHVQEMHSI